MTSHIFTRRGLWPDSIAFNIRAADAASERTPSGMVSMHRMHALDYLTYAYLQGADDVAAEEVLEVMKGIEPPYHNHCSDRLFLCCRARTNRPGATCLGRGCRRGARLARRGAVGPVSPTY